MIVSYNWLKELVDLNGIDKEQFLHDLSLYSIEIDSVENVQKASNLVVGKVLTMEDHPDSDHLHVTTVDVGTEVLQVVCGAPNCQAGKKVIVALCGAKLPGGEIKASKVRGVESFGMLCSLQELGVENKYVPKEYEKGIYFFDDSAVVGTDAIKALMYDDTAIELGLTPNRMDLMSMLGVAQDVSAMYERKLLPLEYSFKESKESIKDKVSIDIKTKNCFSYYGRIVKNVVIKESPQFIKTRLMIAGVRPINNVVDITNYVMMLFGQPLHAFDQDKIGNKIIVRETKQGEKLVTLDDIERTLEEGDIAICDNLEPNGRIIALGGVMGGKDTEVLENTKNIFLESAVFKSNSVRRTSKKLGLRSEASSRYERGVDLNRSLEAVNYACYLLEKHASGEVLKGFVHEGIEHIEDKEFNITSKFINDYLGTNLSSKEISHIFERLGFTSSYEKNDIKVLVPNRRMNISINADLVEEVVRMYGYSKLECTLPIMDTHGELTKSQKLRRLIINELSKYGLNETINYSLVNTNHNTLFNILNPIDSKQIELANPLTEDHFTPRMNLTKSILDDIVYNSSRKVKDNHFFEVGKVYYMLNDEYVEHYHLSIGLSGVFESNFHTHFTEKVDFFTLKGIVENLFDRMGLEVTYKPIDLECSELHPTRTALIYSNNVLLGYIGEVHPRFAKSIDLDETYVLELDLDKVLEIEEKPFSFKRISKIPPVERDLAFVVDMNQNIDEIINAIYSTDKQMISNVEIFDEYIGENVGEGKKSVALRVTYEPEETLTEEEIQAKIKKILKSLEFRFKVTLRQ